MIVIGLLFLITKQTSAQQNKNTRFHKPAYQTAAEKAVREQLELDKTSLQKAFPSQFIMPGEFEESQAVAISWAFDYNSNGVVIGVDTSSEYGYISKQLCDAIQPECTVWIRINKAKDSLSIKNFMAKEGKPLYNYKFIVALGDDWWTRDYGPMAFYYGKDDSIGFTDMKYYSGRNNDNKFPQQLATKMGYKNYVTSLNSEGGNLMTDGFGTMFYSTMVDTQNTIDPNHTPLWSIPQMRDTISNVLACPKLVSLKSLECDGGTGHIDMYVKLLDEQTILIGTYNDEITASDKKIIDANKKYLDTLKSTYNRPYRIISIEMPTDDDGIYSNTTCDMLDQDARTFINGITVNKSFIYPSYYNGLTGNAAQNNKMNAFLKQIMPGYKIIPIDSRIITPGGGAIHCITMQIPAENPVRFWHPSVDGLQPNVGNYHIVAKITNKSGINKASCFWRKNTGAWVEVTLTDSAGYYIGDIVNPGVADTDMIQYYLKATSVNGKIATKPITAPDGYYNMYFKAGVSGFKTETLAKKIVFDIYPNPASQQVKIKFDAIDNNDISIAINDISGKEIYSKYLPKLYTGINEESISLNGLNTGMYFCVIKSNNAIIASKKLIVIQ